MKPVSSPRPSRHALRLLAVLVVGAAGTLSAADLTNSFDGTYRGRVVSELLRHRQETGRRGFLAALSTVPRAAVRDDIGHIAILDDSDGVVLRPNDFDLNQLSITLRPAENGYTAEPLSLGFDEQARELGSPLPLGDDDAENVVLPFSFPFFDQSHETTWVHSDGNLSFVEPDAGSTARSLSRAAAGPPRIAPLFTDLDPTRADAKVTAFVTADRVVFTWDDVPEFTFTTIGRRQTFQAVLHIDGRIDFHYLAVNLASIVVGVMPGGFEDDVRAVDFSQGAATATPGALAEIFTDERDIDPVAVTQKFYRNHGDNYDFIVLFNDLRLPAGPGAFAFELNVRNDVEGIGSLQPDGNPVFDFGEPFGSPLRLQSFLNMGPLSNFPDDPETTISILGHNNTLSVFGQESGHRFLAYVRFLDPMTQSTSKALLGRQDAHWSFFFNSDASVLEGNRITDHGMAMPQFETVGAVEKYSALDQYLMGLREAADVPPSFFVDDPSVTRARGASPSIGVAFDGTRREVTLDMVIDAEGPRRPRPSVAQKDFNFAIVLLVAEGESPTPEKLAKINRIRTEWETYFHQAVDQRGTARTELARRLHLSTWPAAGVILGGSASATVNIDDPLDNDIDVMLSSDSGAIEIPPSVTIPAGAREAAFTVNGASSGIARLTARTDKPGYDTARAIVRVRDELSGVRLSVASGDSQSAGEGGVVPLPVLFQLRDEDKLHYGGVPVVLIPSGDGTATPSRAMTDASGRIAVEWRLASEGVFNILRAEVEQARDIRTTAAAVATGPRPFFSEAGVVNAASFNVAGADEQRVVSPGGLYSTFGTSLTAASEPAWAPTLPLPRQLAGTTVLINGTPAPLLFVSATQINWMAPFDLPSDQAEIFITSAAGSGDAVTLPVRAAQPGIFFDLQTGFGAILNSSNQHAAQMPPAPGETVQIFATGLGAVDPPVLSGAAAPGSPLSWTVIVPRVEVAGRDAKVVFSGLAPLFAGLYQVNAELPEDLPAGVHALRIETPGVSSNDVLLEVR